MVPGILPHLAEAVQYRLPDFTLRDERMKDSTSGG
jgi:hypothetical protein